MCTHSALLKGSHTAVYTAKQGPSLPRSQQGFVLPVNSFLFRHAFIYIHFPVHCEPPLSAERKIRRNCRHKFYPQPFLIPVFNFLHKRPTFAFTGESGYTLGFAQRIAHSGLHAETGGISDGALSLPSTRTARSRTSPVRVPERRALPLLGLGRGYSQRTQRAFGTAMRLCASLSRGVAAPLGCVIFFHFCRNCDLYAIRACARWGWYHYPQRALRAVETPDGRLPKGLICRFLRLPSSTPCAVTFSANTQISLSAISVANTFALWYDKSYKSRLFGDEGEPE